MTARVMPSASLLGVTAIAEVTPIAAVRTGEEPRTGDANAFAQVLAATEGEATPPAATSTGSLDTHVACESDDDDLPVAPVPDENDMQMISAPVVAPPEPSSPSRPIEPTSPFHMSEPGSEDAPPEEIANDTQDANAMPGAPREPTAFVPPTPVPPQPRAIPIENSATAPVTIDAPSIAAPSSAASPLPASPTTDALPIADAQSPAVAPGPTIDAPTGAPPQPSDASSRAPIEAEPKPPIVLSRAADLADAIDQLRPIPRGGATIEVEAPGLGAIRLHVTVDGDTVKIRIHAGSDAIAWFAREHEGLCSAARQAVPESQSVDLQLHTGSDSRGNQSQPHARTYAAPDETPQPQRARTQTPNSEAPTTPTSPRSLVDVLA